MAMADNTKLLRIPTDAGPVLEMYDLSFDPHERTNVAVAGAGRSQELAAELTAWTTRMDTLRPAAATEVRSRRQRRDDRALRGLGYLQ
jgi:hypothetical protein